MWCAGWQRFGTLAIMSAWAITLCGPKHQLALAQEQAPASDPWHASVQPPPVPVVPPGPVSSDKPLPINLPTALQLAGVRPIDIGLASERIRQAAAQLDRAQVLWLPTINLGVEYSRHDGQIQETPGTVFGTSRSSFQLGAGPVAVFAVTDAIFAPLAERQVVRSREAALQTARNDSLLAVAEAYFNVQQARGESAGQGGKRPQGRSRVRQQELRGPRPDEDRGRQGDPPGYPSPGSRGR